MLVWCKRLPWYQNTCFANIFSICKCLSLWATFLMNEHHQIKNYECFLCWTFVWPGTTFMTLPKRSHQISIGLMFWQIKHLILLWNKLKTKSQWLFKTKLLNAAVMWSITSQSTGAGVSSTQATVWIYLSDVVFSITEIKLQQFRMLWHE